MSRRILLRQSLMAIVFALAAGAVAPLSASGGVGYCIQRDRVSNQIADFLVNICNHNVWVTWYDDGDCKTGCGIGVAAKGKQSVTKAKGLVRMAVCESPKSARSDKWKGYGPYDCE